MTFVAYTDGIHIVCFQRGVSATICYTGTHPIGKGVEIAVGSAVLIGKVERKFFYRIA